MDANLTIHFDGSCQPKNPGGIAAYGFEITDSSGKTVHSDSAEVCRGPQATNNIAEWAGLTAAIRYLKNVGWKGNLTILGDSKLVINQLNGKWRCKKEHLQPYLEESTSLLKGMNWTAEWVPRSKNQNADLLSRRG